MDFENKCYTQLLKNELSDIRHKVSEYTYPIDKFVWAETLKDELRGGKSRENRDHFVLQQFKIKFFVKKSLVIWLRIFYEIAIIIKLW